LNKIDLVFVMYIILVWSQIRVDRVYQGRKGYYWVSVAAVSVVTTEPVSTITAYAPVINYCILIGLRQYQVNLSSKNKRVDILNDIFDKAGH